METIVRPDVVRPSALVGMVHHLGYPTVSNRIIPDLNGGGHAARLTGEMQQLRAVNSDLTVQMQIAQPKADYFDSLIERGVNISIRESAKQLGVKEREFVRFLTEHKYLYRDKKGKLTPYAQYADDLFVIKECFNDKSGWGGTQTLTTPKGRETFRLLLEGLRREPHN